jgi:hypothetical protein
MQIRVLCPQCWSTVPIERWRADRREVICATCHRTAQAGELVTQQSISQLLELPRWAERAEHSNAVIYTMTGRSAAGIARYACLSAFCVLFLAAGTAVLTAQVVQRRFDVFFVVLAIGWTGMPAWTLWWTSVPIFGRVTVRVRDDILDVFQGIGRIGRRRVFRRAELVRVQREHIRGGRFLRVTTPHEQFQLAMGFPEERVALLQALIVKLRLFPGPCPRCFYDLSGLPAGSPCPECGVLPDRSLSVHKR